MLKTDYIALKPDQQSSNLPGKGAIVLSHNLEWNSSLESLREPHGLHTITTYPDQCVSILCDDKVKSPFTHILPGVVQVCTVGPRGPLSPDDAKPRHAT